MRGNSKLIETLNLLLADELTAINRYMVHSEMAANWGGTVSCMSTLKNERLPR